MFHRAYFGFGCRQVPTEWQASAFAQHSAAWGLAYAATSPILAAFKEEATQCLALAAICMFFAALLVRDLSLKLGLKLKFEDPGSG